MTNADLVPILLVGICGLLIGIAAYELGKRNGISQEFREEQIQREVLEWILDDTMTLPSQAIQKCEWCREHQSITMTTIYFGKKPLRIHTCAGCNIRLKEEVDRREAEKEAERKRKREMNK